MAHLHTALDSWGFGVFCDQITAWKDWAPLQRFVEGPSHSSASFLCDFTCVACLGMARKQCVCVCFVLCPALIWSFFSQRALDVWTWKYTLLCDSWACTVCAFFAFVHYKHVSDDTSECCNVLVVFCELYFQIFIACVGHVLLCGPASLCASTISGTDSLTYTLLGLLSCKHGPIHRGGIRILLLLGLPYHTVLQHPVSCSLSLCLCAFLFPSVPHGGSELNSILASEFVVGLPSAGHGQRNSLILPLSR